jgi:hypothetical protein
MPWARFDDRFPSNRKVRLLSDGAFRLYVSSICWSAENLTDGVVKTAELRLVADVKSSRTRAQELVEHGLFEELPGIGWRIHDYHEYNPTAEQVKADRAAKTARQQRWRTKHKGDAPDPRPPRRTTDVDASTDASQDASRDAPGDAAPRARGPVPTRPEPLSGAERDQGARSSGRTHEHAPSLITPTWQPTADDIRTAQQARVADGRPTLTGQQIHDVTRKFVRRMTADRREATDWGTRWQDWAERERPTDTGQTPLLIGLNGGGERGPAWPHETREGKPRDATPTPPSLAERMAQLDAAAARDLARELDSGETG